MAPLELSWSHVVQGFNHLAWTVVALQVFGGLIVGMVVKYADNILKNFANALSVIFTVIGAMPLFGQYPSFFFLFGVAGVLLSVFMYGKSTPSGFGAFDSCYRSMSTANLQLLLQSSSSGTFSPSYLLPCLLPAHACTSTAYACIPLFCFVTAVTQPKCSLSHCLNTLLDCSVTVSVLRIS